MKQSLSLSYVRLSFIITISLIFVNPTKAQYVVIPDTAFVTWLQNNGFAGCISGNQLDTTSAGVTNATSLFCHDIFIHDFAGIQYFKNLDTLDFSNCSVDLISSFPPKITFLNCQYDNIASLPALPGSLLTLICNDNQLSSLPVLSSSLRTLDCSNNQISSLPVLPSALTGLYCHYNQLTGLPELPLTLKYLACDDNYITGLPGLSPVLQYLSCGYNQLTGLPALPSTLIELYCPFNQLSELPELPSKLKSLYLYDNKVSHLPDLPGSVTIFDCSDNRITAIPVLPDSLNYFNCSNNLNLACLPQIKIVVNLYFGSTAIVCIPDYGMVTSSSPPLNSLPVCGITSLTCPYVTDIALGAVDGDLALTLYPNPAKNFIGVEVGQSMIGGFMQITDANGAEVIKSQIPDARYQIPITTLSRGMYFVKVSLPVVSGNKELIAVKKLVVE